MAASVGIRGGGGGVTEVTVVFADSRKLRIRFEAELMSLSGKKKMEKVRKEHLGADGLEIH